MKLTFFSSIVIVMGLTLAAHAHQTKDISRATNPALEAVREVAAPLSEKMNERFNGNGGGTVFAAYKVVEINPPKQAKETDEQVTERILKAILHRDYPITGDDGGYSFKKINGKSAEQIRKSLTLLDDADETTLSLQENYLKALASAGKSSALVVLVGSGSGNNTMADIVAVLDLENQEFIYLMDSNFGSDN